MNILVTGTHREATNTLTPVVKELVRRGHDVTVYATGNEREAAGFNGLEYEQQIPTSDQYIVLVQGYDLVVAGVSGPQTPDGYVIRAARDRGIPVVGVVGQNRVFNVRFGTVDDLPDHITVPGEDSYDLVREAVGECLATEIIRRAVPVGFPAFDHYAATRERFTSKRREAFVAELELEGPFVFYPSANLDPNTDYMRRSTRDPVDKRQRFEYALRLTEETFRVASDLGLHMVVKPHPGEQTRPRHTLGLAERFGVTYLSYDRCGTQDLLLASAVVVAGESGCLNEGCLFDRNTGALFPGLDEDVVPQFSATKTGAIPYTFEWEGIGRILTELTSSDEDVQRRLADQRKRFSVDGKGAQRVADLVERVL